MLSTGWGVGALASFMSSSYDACSKEGLLLRASIDVIESCCWTGGVFERDNLDMGVLRISSAIFFTILMG